MRNIPNPPVVTIGIILALGIIGGTALTACGKKEDPSPQTELVVERITTSGQAANLYAACVRGAYLVYTSGGHAMVQILDSTGKPMECK